ncbi:MAG: Holliday junction resolvase RuvX [Patescibacteria group bacterium]
MRVLGIDYGEKNIGLALGDTDSKIATPWGTILNESALAVLSKIHDLMVRDMVDAIVVGIPKPLRDSRLVNAQVKKVKEFIRGLDGLGIKVFEENEVMSSLLAARQATELGEKEKRDDLEAAAILQSWLNKKKE